MSKSRVGTLVLLHGVGRNPSPSTRGRKDKSCDAISSIERRFVRLELGVANTKEWMDLLEQSMEKAVKDLKVQIQDLQEGMQGSPVHSVSHEKFMTFQDKVLSVLARLESRVEVLLDIVQSFPLLSYCIVSPMSVYIYKSNM